MSNEIETVETIGRLALAQDGATLKSVAAALLAEAPLGEPKKLKVPAKVTMTDELVSALTVLPAVFAKEQVTAIRQLPPEELTDLAEEQETITAILKPLDTRLAAIKDAIRHHLDLTAVADGRVTPETEVDANGHYVVARKGMPDTLPMPGTNQAWSNEYKSGTTEIDGSKLLAMYEDGVISRATYLAFTKEVRVFDETKAFASISKDPSLLGIFKKIIKRGRSGSSLYVRKQS
jgi:hypothetical protein